MSENGNWGRKPNDLKNMKYAGRSADSELVEALLGIIAIGVAGGLAAIAGAKKLGEEIQELQEERARKLAEKKAAYKQKVREVVANEVETQYDTAAKLEDPTDELILSPSPLEEQPESVELMLEASKKKPMAEITFDGQDDAEKRMESAMAEYDTAMDEAAE